MLLVSGEAPGLTFAVVPSGTAPTVNRLRTHVEPGRDYAEDAGRRWIAYPVFHAPTPILSDQESHISVLSSGHSPHAPQVHLQEEVLLVLEGELEVLVDGRDSYDRLAPGSFVYWPSYWPHTIRNVSPQPATYIVVKWQAESLEIEEPLRTATFHPSDIADPTQPIAMHMVFEGPTSMLSKLHCHLTELQPGAGYAPHADEHDVMIVVLSGIVETLGQTVTKNGAIYYSAGELHGMRNVGEERALFRA